MLGFKGLVLYSNLGYERRFVNYDADKAVSEAIKRYRSKYPSI